MRRLFFISLTFTLLLSGLTFAQAASVLLEDFEQNLPVYINGEGIQPGTAVSVSSEQTQTGDNAVKLQVNFNTGVTTLQYVGFGTSQLLPGNPAAVYVWVYGDASGQSMRLRLNDVAGETFQYIAPDITWTGWQQVRIDLVKPDVSWGGDQDGKWSLPLTFNALLIDSKVEPYSSVLYFDDLTVESEVAPMDTITVNVTSEAFGGIIWGDQLTTPPKIHIRNLNIDTAVEGTVKLQITDSRGQIGEAITLPVSLAPGAKTVLDMPVLEMSEGQVTVKGDVITGTGSKPFTARFTRFASAYPKTDLEPDSFFGACTHFGQGKGNLGNTFKLMSNAGIKWLRDEISWGAVEATKGKYEVPQWADTWMNSAVENGITPLIILDYGNPYYDDGNAPTSPEAQEAFGEYSYTLVKHYKDICKYWEIYNEPNIGFWRPTPDPVAYARLMKIAYTRCKEADPTCTVVGVCTAGTDMNFIRKVLEEGGMDYMDVLSIHPYRYPSSPESSDFVGELKRCHELMKEFGGGDKKIWLTEIGWPTHDQSNGVSEVMSGNYYARMHALSLAQPFVERVFWYDFQNDGLDKSYNENNFGLITWDRFEAKENYIAAKITTEHLGDAKFIRQLLPADAKDKRYCLEFEQNGKPVYMAWCDGGSETLALNVNQPEVSLSWTNATREQRPTIDGTLVLALEEMPVFITGAPKGAKVVSSPLKIKLEPSVMAPGERGYITVQGPRGTQTKLELAGDVPISSFTQEPGKNNVWSFRVRLRATPGVGIIKVKSLLPDGREVASGATTLQVVSPAQISLRAPEVNKKGEVTIAARLRNPRDLRQVIRTLLVDAGPGIEAGSASGPFNIPPMGSTVVPQAVSLTSTGPGITSPVDVGIMTEAGEKVVSAFEIGVWEVPFVSEAPVIDGSGSDWPKVVPATPGSQPGDFFVLQAGSWTGPEDLSAKVRLAWNDKGLYLLADVTDDKHIQPQSGAEVWKSDNIQLAFDFRHRAWDRLDSKQTANWPELGLSRTSKGDEVYRWLWKEGEESGVQLRTERQGVVTTYEVFLPWAALDAQKPGTDTLAGFALIVNEDDGAGRDGWLELYSGIGFGGKDPRRFGSLRFVK